MTRCILIIASDHTVRQMLTTGLSSPNHETIATSGDMEALEHLQQTALDLIVTQVDLAHQVAIFGWLRDGQRSLPVVNLAFDSGVLRDVKFPRWVELRHIIDSALTTPPRVWWIPGSNSLGRFGLIGRSKAMRDLFSQMQR